MALLAWFHKLSPAMLPAIEEYIASYQIPLIDYVITSPPYWDMLHARGAQTQKNRRTLADPRRGLFG